MNETIISDSDTEISTDSSWTVVEEEDEGEESEGDAVFCEDDEVDVAGRNAGAEEASKSGEDDDLVIVEGDPAERDSSTVVDISSSCSTIREFLEQEERARGKVKTDGFLSLEEMIQERLIEHDYEFDNKSDYCEDLSKAKDEGKRKPKREQCKGQVLGTLSVVGTVLAMTGISFICMLIPTGSSPPADLHQQLAGNVTNFTKIDEKLYGECPVYYDADTEKLTVTDVNGFVEKCQNVAEKRFNDDKHTVGFRKSTLVTFEDFMKAGIHEPKDNTNFQKPPSKKPEEKRDDKKLFVFSATPNETSPGQETFSNAILPKKSSERYRSVKNITKEQSRRQKTVTNLNAGALACNMLQDVLLLRMTKKLRRKSEKHIKRLKRRKKDADQERESSQKQPPLQIPPAPQPENNDNRAAISISFVDEVQAKPKPTSEKAALFTVLPFGQQPEVTGRARKTGGRNVEFAKRKILTARRRTSTAVNQLEKKLEASGSGGGGGVCSKVAAFEGRGVEFGCLKAKLRTYESLERVRSIEKYKRQNRENFEALKKIRLEYEDHLKKGATGTTESAEALQRLRRAREKYIEHLKRSQDEFIKQIRRRREEESENLRALVKERQERQQKDAASGIYEIPVFDNLETRRRLKELKAKENKLCDLVYCTLPQSCFNDTYDCECKFEPASRTSSSNSLDNIEKNLSQLEVALDNAQKVAQNYYQWAVKWREQVACELHNSTSEPGLKLKIEEAGLTPANIENLLDGGLKRIGEKILDKLKRQETAYINRICRHTYKYWDMKRKYLEKRTSVVTNTDIIMKNVINNYRNDKGKRDDEVVDKLSCKHVGLLLDGIISQALKNTDLKITPPPIPTNHSEEGEAFGFDEFEKASITSSSPVAASNTAVIAGEDESRFSLTEVPRAGTSDPDAIYKWLFGRRGPEIRRKEKMLMSLQRVPHQTRMQHLSKHDPRKTSKERNVKKHFAR